MLKCHEIQRCFSGSPQGGRHSCTCSGGAQVLRGCPLGRGEDELQCPGVGSRGAEGFGNLEGVGIWTPLQRGERVSGCVQSCFSCLTLFDLINCSPPGSSVHGDSPGKNTGVSCHALLQGIYSTQRLNLYPLCLLLWQVGSLVPAPPGKPEKEWGSLVLASSLSSTMGRLREKI